MTRSTIFFSRCFAAGCGGARPRRRSARTPTSEGAARGDQALGRRASDASKEVPRLLTAMNDPDPEVAGARSSRWDGSSSPRPKALTVALRDDSPKIRWAAAYALGPLGKNAPVHRPGPAERAFGQRSRRPRLVREISRRHRSGKFRGRRPRCCAPCAIPIPTSAG